MVADKKIQHATKKTSGFPRLCLVGPMLGANPGWVVSQGEILARHFQDEGWPVRLTSPVPGRVKRLVDTIRSLIAWRNEYDMAVVMVFSGPSFFMADISSSILQQLGKPIIYYLRGGDLPNFSRKNNIWVKEVLRRGKAICSPSDYLARYFNRIGFQVEVIPNIIDISRYPFRQRTNVSPRLLWMRTFHPIYNPEMAVNVLAKLIQRYPDARLTMAGQDKGILTSIEQKVKKAKLSANVRFAGFLDIDQKKAEFATHDIYLHTNRVDNMPVSVVEAAAFGLPIIATKVDGIPFLLEHEKTALLVEDEDVDGMANAVRRLLNDQELAFHISNNGRLLAESFTWSNVFPQWQELLKQIYEQSV